MQLLRGKYLLAVMALQEPLTLAAAVPIASVELAAQPPLLNSISARGILSNIWSTILSPFGLASRGSDKVEYTSYGEYGQYGQYGSYGAYPPLPEDTSPTPTYEDTSPAPVPEATFSPASYPDDCNTSTTDEYFTTSTPIATTTKYLTSIGTPIWTYSPSTNIGGDADSTTYVKQPITTITVALSSLLTAHEMRTYTHTLLT